MANYRVVASKLHGSLAIPASKSHTLRAILFAALAKGTSRIEQHLTSPDTQAMIDAVRLLGAKVDIQPNFLEIEGTAGKVQPAEDVIQCGNSGIVLRFIGALAGLLPQYTILTGDTSIRHNRPVLPLLNGLQQLGAFATSSRGDSYAPILIKGPLTKSQATLDGQDSQPVSGLIIAGAFAPYPIELNVLNPGEKPWIDLTLDWLTRLGIPYEAHDYTSYRLKGNAEIHAFGYTVPGDFSTSAFPIAAALLTDSELTLHAIDMNDCQGDKKLIAILEKMGARFDIDEKKRTLTVLKGARLKGVEIDINDCIDALPILAVISCFAEGTTQIVNGSIARAKESDRLTSIAQELKKMGAHLEEQPDGLVIHHSTLNGAELHSHNDHRLAMALTVAALATRSPSLISGVQCIAKSYPNFFEEFSAIGAEIERTGK